MTMNVGIIGRGGIAQCLRKRLAEEGVTVSFMHHHTDTESFATRVAMVKLDAVFLAISTKDTGEAAARYIMDSVSARVPVVTCEKGALSYHMNALNRVLPMIGYSATVGGGTMLLQYAKMRNLNSGRPVFINAVMNGTLNYIFDCVGNGSTLSEACYNAKKSGYAEPGADDDFALLNGELNDVHMKCCVFFNTVLADDLFITPRAFQKLKLTEKWLRGLSEKGGCVSTGGFIF